MSLRMLLETLRCENGTVLHLSHHQERLERSLRSLKIQTHYDLEHLIIPPSSGLYRCRFLYSESDYRIEFLPYTPRPVRSIKLISADALHYPLKYENRKPLDLLFQQRGECDDVLIIKNGFLTDTTIANIALYIDGKWFTPQTPLLNGTTRSRLLDEGFLTPALLTEADIGKATKIAVMNAMVGFIEVENGIIA
ncbi:MAG: aminotransferase class IV [Sulfuricurvum sp.]|nr:aminotransferase class IV [Sulfuricurvum sp.]